MKAKLREDNLTIEVAETLLEDKYKAMKEVQGWTEDGMSLHCLLASHISRKQSKGNVDIVVHMVIRQLIVVKEKQILKTRKLDMANLSPIRTENQSGKRGTKKARSVLTYQRLTASTVTNMDTLLEIAPTKKIKQI